MRETARRAALLWRTTTSAAWGSKVRGGTGGGGTNRSSSSITAPSSPLGTTSTKNGIIFHRRFYYNSLRRTTTIGGEGGLTTTSTTRSRRHRFHHPSSQSSFLMVKTLTSSPSKPTEQQNKPTPMRELRDEFLNANSVAYLEEMEKRFKEEGGEIGMDKSWSTLLKSLDKGMTGKELSSMWEDAKNGNAPVARERRATPSSSTAPSEVTSDLIQESMRLLLLVRAYQTAGHEMATLDPLGMGKKSVNVSLDPELYGFTEKDLDREFFLGTWRMKGFLAEDQPYWTLRDILSRLRETYCGNIGYEYMHIMDREKCNWLREQIETPTQKGYKPERKKILFERLARAELFETFLSNKYTAAKRFGLEGCETLIPGFEEAVDRAADLGVKNINIGMPHRGRLNVLANVIRKPLQTIFNEFKGGPKPTGELGLSGSQYTGSGDVKYHLGTSVVTRRGVNQDKKVQLSLLANPSHLEAVDTVVIGKCAARQFYTKDYEKETVIPVLLHGDGAFSGQGIVYETLDMSQLPEYHVGGTLHIVVNNQVAFTTDPKHSRSSMYCTDVAKCIEAPVFHVNGDDVEAVAWVMQLALEWRQKFKADAVVDIVCYRKFGHNEIDEPMFTQPLMYKVIKKHVSAHQQYAEKLVKEGVLTADEVKAKHTEILKELDTEFEMSKNYVPKFRDWVSSHWQGFKSPDQFASIRNTGVDPQVLREVGAKITEIPETFTPHKIVKRVYDARRKMFETGENVDWATAEMLAFGTLLNEGNHVRLSGQDVERGTFSHRHAVIKDQSTGERFVPLRNLYRDKIAEKGLKYFTVCNSSLSEFGVLGFELGYSLDNPNSLVIWEAQFGDFANSAQVIIDQFISSGEAKWLRQTGLTLLLPHGYDGQGPEHSSARLERFLQMSDEDPRVVPDMSQTKRLAIQGTNWQICNVTTPANYFHLLRRQIHRDYRKPLIVMSPKNLLRHPKCLSPLSEFDDVDSLTDAQGTRFKRLIMDKTAKVRGLTNIPVEDHVQRLVFCSGKVYYELDAEREALKAEDTIKICRIEQLAPFPWDLVERELKRYPNAEVVWCQEEPLNMGAYTHVDQRIRTLFKHHGKEGELKYAGRNQAASPSTGYGSVHAEEQIKLIKDALVL